MGNDNEIFQLEDELFNEPEFNRLIGFCFELSGSSDSHELLSINFQDVLEVRANTRTWAW